MSQRINLAKSTTSVNYPDLLALQLESFKQFFQTDALAKNRKKEELYKIFQENFPISDTKNHFTLEFVDYSIEDPLYTPQECLQKALTYGAPLKVRLRLVYNDEEDPKSIEQKLFWGNIPYMTPQGSFIINGKERVVVSQIHRSYGAFFARNNHASGIEIYSAKIIPFRGSWIEFVTDIHNTVYVYIDRKKKLPLTILLRALGYGTDKQILELFDLAEEIEATKENLLQNKGRKLAARVLNTWTEDFVDPETGEVISITRNRILLDRDTILDDQAIQTILTSHQRSIVVCKKQLKENDKYYSLLHNTFKKDETNSEKEAMEHIYRVLRSTEPPDEQAARELVSQLFFSTQRSFLGKVGRYCINKKLNLNVPSDTHVLTKEDILQTIKHLFDFVNNKSTPDDIDHLGNRRVRVVGEQLRDVFNIGILRVGRLIRERMNVRTSEEFTPADLVSARIFSSVINSYFGTNPLSQFMDQENILSELSHKRRISSMGVGGLTKERAGFEVRDVHYTHYGRTCVVQTPEGLNIGLISSLAIHAKIDPMGFIQTPYRKVSNGKVDITNPPHYLTADQEEVHLIAQATSEIDSQGNFSTDKVKVRRQSDFLLVEPKEVSLMDVAKDQIVAIAPTLIPFIENTDASRSLMGANMQHQALPLLQSESPIVGTGMEARVVKDARSLPIAEEGGTVTYVDANKIVIKHESPQKELLVPLPQTKTYHLRRLVCTNQGTCINLKPIVHKGQQVEKGQILCQGYGTQDGELALGRNLVVAFMSWKGHNFEDGIVISDRVLKEDIFTSIHIEEFTADLSETKLGPEEFTKEIPNVSEEAIQNLDENGVVSVGEKVKEGDILIGKIIPRSQSDLPPEHVLLQAIFGDKAYNVKDASIKAPPSFEGTVIETEIFARNLKDKQTREAAIRKITLLQNTTNQKLAQLKQQVITKLAEDLSGTKTIGIYDIDGNTVVEPQTRLTKQVILQNIFAKKELNIQLEEAISIQHIKIDQWTESPDKNETTELLLQSYINHYNTIIQAYKREKFKLEVGDDLPFGTIKRAKVRIGKKRKLKVGDKMAGRHGNKGIVAKIARQEDLPYFEDGTSVDIVLNPLGLSSRMNIGQLFEALLGAAGKKLGRKYAVPIFSGVSMDKVSQELKEANLPPFGRTMLYDGCTGEPFSQKVTVGNLYMMKLNHSVDEKAHARSTGPYGIITQQPLGGRARFGGQRLGEMEVQALQAYGAAHILQESLTIKSDDVVGRKRTYEAIVKGKELPTPGMPESIKVLKHELRGLGIELTFR